jgi:hypothetical protein
MNTEFLREPSKIHRRLELHEILLGLLNSLEVYFQPPATVSMKYPCIIYQRSGAETTHADDQPYNSRIAYQVMVVDPDPDSDIPGLVARLPLCRFDRHYTVDNLNHDVFTIYY